MEEKDPVSHSESVNRATQWAMSLGADSLLSVPIDTPGVTVGELVAMSQLRDQFAVVVAPSADGTGTNALLLTPPEALPPRFGPDSLARHVREAGQRAVAHRLFSLPRLALDVDSPADLATFLAAAGRAPQGGTRTYEHLLRTGIAERCRARTP